MPLGPARDEGSLAELSGAAFGAGLVALAAGSRLVVRTVGGMARGVSDGGSDVTMDVDVGATLGLYMHLRCCVCLHPDGLHVAGVTDKGVTVRAVHTGDEVFALGPWAGRPGCSSKIWDACLD